MLEFGINKDQLVRKNQENAAQTIREEKTMYESALEQMEERTQTLQESKFKVGGISYQDSGEMKLVKQYQQAIAGAMREAVPQDAAVLEKSIQMFEYAYAGLIQACEHYIRTHTMPRTEAGRARLQLVQGTLNLARQESKQFRKTAVELQKVAVAEHADYVWGNILGSIRGAEFDLDQMQNIERGGAATSEVKILHTGRDTFFFKAEEFLNTAPEEFKRQYLDTAKNEEDYAIYAELMRVVQSNALDSVFATDPTIVSALKHGKTDEELDAAFGNLVNGLRMNGQRLTLDWKNQRVREIVKEVMPRIDVWGARYSACRGADIEKGESLSKRNVLTSRMAVILQVPELVAHSNVTTLYQGGKQVDKGIAMAKAKGTQHAELMDRAEKEGKKVVYSAEAMRQFSCLYLMDAVCGQVDRHYANRFVTFTEEGDRLIITGVQGIDHDLSFGLLDYDRVAFGRANFPAFENRRGNLLMKALDADMVNLLRALTKEDLQYYLGDLLEERYIDAMWNRCQGVLRKIVQGQRMNPHLLVKKADWNVDVAKRFETANADYAGGYIWVQAGEVVADPVAQNP